MTLFLFASTLSPRCLSVRRFSRLHYRLPKSREKHGLQQKGCQRAEFCSTEELGVGCDEHVVADSIARVLEASDRINYRAATRLCISRKYAATNTNTNPFTPNTIGAVNMGTSHPVTRFPIGMPPRKAQL